MDAKGYYPEQSTEDVRDKEVMDVRLQLAKDEKLLAACRQEMYDYTIEEIQTMLSDPQQYLDPKLFVKLLEFKFKCNIFTFRAENEAGEIIIPRHVKNYITLKNRQGPIICVLEHYGSKEVDMAEYPQCELIIVWNKLNPRQVEYSFSLEDAVGDGIVKVFNSMNKSYSLNFPGSNLNAPINWGNFGITQQCIDTYGKCRMIYINHEEEEISVFVSPIPPLPVKERLSVDIYKTQINTAQKILSKFGVEKSSLGQVVYKGVTQELYGKVGDITISIPVSNGEKSVKGYKITTTPSYINISDNSQSVLSIYNRHMKYARYLIEYTYWLFSKFIIPQLKNKGITTTDQESIYIHITNNIITYLEEFVNNYVELKEDVVYNNIPSEFITNGGFMKNGKLVLQDMETLQRLIYTLKLGLENRPMRIVSYSEKYTYIPNYYESLTDFDTVPNQIIFTG